jgi:hypothetical protein
MATENRNLADLLTGAARNCWLALSEDETRIVGKGQTIEEALGAAEKNGEQDPVIVWSPKVWRHAVYGQGTCLD